MQRQCQLQVATAWHIAQVRIAPVRPQLDDRPRPHHLDQHPRERNVPAHADCRSKNAARTSRSGFASGLKSSGVGSIMRAIVTRSRRVICRADAMQIRPATLDDLAGLAEIDGTVESTRYLHVDYAASDQRGGRHHFAWRLEERPARQKLIESNRLDDDAAFTLKSSSAARTKGTRC
jgi:hypothetical protein